YRGGPFAIAADWVHPADRRANRWHGTRRRLPRTVPFPSQVPPALPAAVAAAGNSPPAPDRARPVPVRPVPECRHPQRQDVQASAPVLRAQLAGRSAPCAETGVTTVNPTA